MLQAVKRLVGAARGDAPSYAPPELDREALERPVAAARERLEVTRAAHKEAMARCAEMTEQIDVATGEFNETGSDVDADKVLDLKRKNERVVLFAQRTQRAAVAAESEVREAESARNAAILAHQRERVRTAPARAMELWRVKGEPALQALAAFVDELDQLIAEARVAAVEVNRGDTIQQHAAAMGIEGLRSLVRDLASKGVSPAALVKIERLVG